MQPNPLRALEPSAARWILLAALGAGLGGGCLGGGSGLGTGTLGDGGAGGDGTTGSGTAGAGGAGTTSSSAGSGGASASSSTATAGSGGAGSGSAAAPQLSSQQCYFTSYPEGSLHCVTAPCTVTNIAEATPTCTTDGGGYENFAVTAVGGAIYGAYPQSAGSEAGLIVALYPNASSTFPACLDGGASVEPSDPGDYYGTGLVVGQTSMAEVAHFCTGSIGTFP